jgi:hypothetical protein
MNPVERTMESIPRRKRGTLFFWFLFLVIAAAIGATVLLANDRRNYHRLARALGIPITETMVIPKPGTMEKFKGKRLKGVQVMLDSYVFMPEIKGWEGAFLRNMHKDGETLCELFDRLGFKMSQWQPGTFSRKVRECWSEATIANPDKPDEPSTFFLMIKGAPDGTLLSTRVKFIFTSEAARAELTKKATQVLTEFAKATNWLEIDAEKYKVTSLTPFSTNLSGLSAKFSSEFGGAGRYNLIFAKAGLNVMQRRTEAFFDRERFYPLLPEHGGPPIPEAKPEQKAKT